MKMTLPLTSNPSNQDTQVRRRLYGSWVSCGGGDVWLFLFIYFWMWGVCLACFWFLNPFTSCLFKSLILSQHSTTPISFRKAFHFEKVQCMSRAVWYSNNILLYTPVLFIFRTLLFGYYIYQPWEFILKLSTLWRNIFFIKTQFQRICNMTLDHASYNI